MIVSRLQPATAFWGGLVGSKAPLCDRHVSRLAGASPAMALGAGACTRKQTDDRRNSLVRVTDAEAGEVLPGGGILKQVGVQTFPLIESESLSRHTGGREVPRTIEARSASRVN